MSVLDSFNLDSRQCFINGSWVDSASGDTLTLQNPSTGQSLADIAKGCPADIDAAVAAAQLSLRGPWGGSTALERGRVLQKLSALVLDHIEELAHLEALDVGKPLTQARNDAIALARYCEFYAGAADKVHGSTLPYLEGYTVYTLREPHGVTAHIVPWNYPMQIIGRSIGAALAMGNATILKPAEEACLTALAFAELAHRAGLPAGALNVVPGLGAEVGHYLSAHPEVHHVSFTGSVEAGKSVQQAAATHVAPVTLELGGKSAQIVFDDANLRDALPFLLNSGIQNAGQTCSAASRILVQESVHEQVVSELASRIASLTVGPALDDPSVGPLISAKQKQRVEQFLAEGDDLTQVASGELLPQALASGHFVLPTCFDSVPSTHTLAQEEIFGPVLLVIPFSDEDEAIAIANGTRYGLVASVWTGEGSRQMRMAKSLRAGQVFINNYGAGGGVELPFGGVGESGHGREKGFEALYGFSTLKTVAAKHG
ncbi:MAG: aldehyde dehydrogenase family protein [Gammaproteobacteria bacterium]|nr:aldehyde dehydrogenase family protein [Gammaproteobacteria bacterium]